MLGQYEKALHTARNGILLYPGLRTNASLVRDLNVCWNSVYRKIYHYNRWESVKCSIKGPGRMDLVHSLAFQTL